MLIRVAHLAIKRRLTQVRAHVALFLKPGSLTRQLLLRLLPPIILLVSVDLVVTWLLTRQASLASTTLHDIFWTMLLFQLALLCLFVVLLWRGLQGGLTALHQLSAQLAEQEAEALLRPLRLEGLPSELIPLALHFNDVLAQLDDTLQAQKRFIGHAAHQFRTPLSSLRLESELMLTKELPLEMQARAERIKQISDRLIRLGEQMLVLAKADHTAQPRHSFERLDLCEWLRQEGAEWFAQISQAGGQLQLIAPSNAIWIDGDPILLKELFVNLMDNALRYGGQPPQITLRAQANPPGFSVEDQGVGLGEKEVQHIFEAFYRAPHAKGSVGSGLGLAIVREIAVAHGAWVQASSRPRFAGTKISVVFPGPRIGARLTRS